jgi:LysM repeat protein
VRRATAGPLWTSAAAACALVGVVVAAACASPERVRQRPGETLPPLPPTVSVRRASTTTTTVLAVYVVQRGDTLDAIAARLGVDLEDLVAVNVILDPNRIEVGQTLVLPTTTTVP